MSQLYAISYNSPGSLDSNVFSQLPPFYATPASLKENQDFFLLS